MQQRNRQLDGQLHRYYFGSLYKGANSKDDFCGRKYYAHRHIDICICNYEREREEEKKQAGRTKQPKMQCNLRYMPHSYKTCLQKTISRTKCCTYKHIHKQTHTHTHCVAVTDRCIRFILFFCRHWRHNSFPSKTRKHQSGKNLQKQLKKMDDFEKQQELMWMLHHHQKNSKKPELLNE